MYACTVHTHTHIHFWNVLRRKIKRYPVSNENSYTDTGQVTRNYRYGIVSINKIRGDFFGLVTHSGREIMFSMFHRVGSVAIVLVKRCDLFGSPYESYLVHDIFIGISELVEKTKKEKKNKKMRRSIDFKNFSIPELSKFNICISHFLMAFSCFQLFDIFISCDIYFWYEIDEMRTISNITSFRWIFSNLIRSK